jgi:uncharacterized protein YprB with RNaseH-like and TPR domain
MLPDAVYMNCDLPSVCRALSDPEPFLDSLPDNATVIFDEIHRLDDPSRVLKIAADAYSHLKVLATGSSTLAATRKFRDSLTGRKHAIYLPPVVWEECLGPFGIRDLDRRLLHGGLPEPMLSSTKDPSFFSEWMDSRPPAGVAYLPTGSYQEMGEWALPADAADFLAGRPGFDFRRAVFLDTETSGLAGGAGTIVFLTGVGTFEEDAYVVRQFFARNPAEERAYLPDLARFVAERGGLVTFNGRSFDWPLLRSRFILSGIAPPDEQPHVDLLHPARRLWRPRLGACNFGNLERRILDYQRSGLDIPSYMIPSLWFSFARGQGSVREMEAVLYHNLEDIVSMVPLAHVIAATLSGAREPHPQDLPALGRAWQRANRSEKAEAAYRRALDAPLPPSLRAQTLRELALLLKRQNRRDEAAVFWRALADMRQSNDVEALVELAKYHEWHTGDIEKARALTLEAITRAETWTPVYRRRDMLADLTHRLERLERK